MGENGEASSEHAVVGEGPDALLLPALSSVSTRDEMRLLAARLGRRWRCRLADWPGFGGPVPSGARLAPALLDAHLDRLLAEGHGSPPVGVSAGHGAFYLLRAARRHPGRLRGLVLVAPTWRGPLPTMTGGRRPGLCRTARALLEAPLLGPLLFAANLSRPVTGWMLREHVFADPRAVTPALVAAKQAAAYRPGGRLGTAAFVSGGLDPAASRDEALALLEGDLPPVLMLRPRGAPPRSGAEMDALAATGRLAVAEVDGALASHEEHPDGVAAAILATLGRDG